MYSQLNSQNNVISDCNFQTRNSQNPFSNLWAKPKIEILYHILMAISMNLADLYVTQLEIVFTTEETQTFFIVYICLIFFYFQTLSQC